MIPAAALLLGLSVRLWRLDARSYWGDEAVTAQAAGFGDLAGLIRWTAADFQMPLFNLAVWALGRSGLDSDWWLRLPAAAAGAAAVWPVYRLGVALWGRPEGGLAAALVALSPFLVWFSQECRAYSFVLLAAAWQLRFAERALARGRARDWVGLALWSVAGLYIHYAGVVALLAVLVIVARRLLPAADVALFCVAAYLPWVPITHQALTLGRTDVLNPAAGQTLAAGLLDGVRALGLVSLTGLAAVAGTVVALRQRGRPAWVLGTWVLLPLLFFLVRLGPEAARLRPRYLIGLLPAILLLAARGALAADRRGRLGLLIALQAALALGLSYGWPKDDWRDAAARIHEGGRPAQVVVLGPGREAALTGLDRYLSEAERAPAGGPSGPGPVWAVVLTENSDPGLRRQGFVDARAGADPRRLAPSAEVETWSYARVTVARARARGLTPEQQYRLLSAWAGGA